MFAVKFTEEEKKKLEAARTARAGKAHERNTAAESAYKKALEQVGYDETSLIVYPMPDSIGGAVIYKVPEPQAWAVVSKRITKALLSDGRKDDSAAAIASIVERADLLVHPDLPELQQWREELPDLYNEVHNAMDARCSHGQTAGK